MYTSRYLLLTFVDNVIWPARQVTLKSAWCWSGYPLEELSKDIKEVQDSNELKRLGVRPVKLFRNPDFGFCEKKII